MSVLERTGDQAVEPELAGVMRRAFQKTRDVLQSNGHLDVATTDLITTKIIELAQSGERDPDRLCNGAVMAFQRDR